MNFRVAYGGHYRTRRFLRRLWIDVVPILLLLLAMSFAMAVVARFIERTHYFSASNGGLVIKQI